MDRDWEKTPAEELKADQDVEGMWQSHSTQGGRVQCHIRFDHGLESGLAFPVCKLVHKVARHARCMTIEPEETVVVAQGPGCPQCQCMGHTGVCLQLPREVCQLRSDVSRVLGEYVVEDSVRSKFTHIACQVFSVQRLKLCLALVEFFMVTLLQGNAGMGLIHLHSELGPDALHLGSRKE